MSDGVMQTKLVKARPAGHSCEVPARSTERLRVMPGQELHCCYVCLQWWWLTWRESKLQPGEWVPVDKRVSRRKAVRLMRDFDA